MERVASAQFTVFSHREGPSELKKNREFFRDIRELKFPVTSSSSESLLIFCDLVAKSATNSHYVDLKLKRCLYLLER